ncbi:MAG: M56 family metallopeptidase [Bdellovibrionales bacterium]|nr:M56 family metallopeptidase [Bdellovibrionales bacterium]
MMTSHSLLQGLVQVAVLGNLLLFLFVMWSRVTSGVSPRTKSLIWRTSLIPFPILLFWTERTEWVENCMGNVAALCPQWLGVAVSALQPMSHGRDSGSNEFFLVAWLLGAVALGLLGVGTYMIRLRAWLHAGEPVAKELGLLIGGVARRLGLRRSPPAWKIQKLGSPAVVGVWSPKLIIPDNMDPALSEPELRAAIAHELAHLRNGDHWWNFYLWLNQCAFFFVPLLWIAGREIHRVQEMAADEVAVTLGGARRSQLASALAWVGAGLQPSTSVPFVASALRPKQALKNRIAALAGYQRPRILHTWVSFFAVGILVFGFTFAAEKFWPTAVIVSSKARTGNEPIMCYPIPDIMKTIEATKKGRC